jgi:tRNA (guanosine-2'-O-)-methyltransferase
MLQKRIDKITRVVQERQRGLVVVLEDIHDPHNAAAIIRTCDAFGIQHVYFIFEQETPYSPNRIGKSTSSSANKWVDFSIFKKTQECLEELESQKFHLFATGFTQNAVPLPSVQFTDDNIAILVGNEHRGLSEYALNHAHQTISIPMYGFVQSLNVSVATALVLWEVVKQRRSNGSAWKLSQKEHESLVTSFLDRAKK